MTCPVHYDAHCHLFGSEYLLREVCGMVRDHLSGRYPGRSGCRCGATPAFPDLTSLKRLVAWLAEALDAFAGDEASHFKHLSETVAGIWNDGETVIVAPLMMDLYFMCADPVDKGDWAKTKKRSVRSRERSVSEDVVQVATFLKEAGLGPLLVKEFVDTITSEKKIAARSRVAYDESPGFALHRERLEALSTTYSGRVLPFLAVDPRRKGLVDAILKGGLVGSGRPFRGIKLYPRLGYHPACQDLLPLYEWCAKKAVPVTVHCSHGGFPPWDDRYKDFSAPCQFADILRTWRNLKVNFAHFGAPRNGKTDWSWSDTIVELMKHPNVYTDLSCYTAVKELRDFKKRYWPMSPVKERVMFGTDYDIFGFTDAVSLKGYCENFHGAPGKQGVFSKGELAEMDTVAATFLS